MILVSEDEVIDLRLNSKNHEEEKEISNKTKLKRCILQETQ